MAKIGRNDPCPCGSGKKFKRCCLGRTQGSEAGMPVGQTPKTLAGEIDRIREAAAAGRREFFELGVFLLFSDEAGDAWLLEVTDQDGVQVAAAGNPREIGLEESPETIAVDWSHTFTIQNRDLVLKAYDDGRQSVLESAPVQQIHAAIRRIRKRYAPELLAQVHLREDEPSPAT